MPLEGKLSKQHNIGWSRIHIKVTGDILECILVYVLEWYVPVFSSVLNQQGWGIRKLTFVQSCIFIFKTHLVKWGNDVMGLGNLR